MTKNRKNGFTLVELVIVIAIIGILAAVLIPTFSSVIGSAKETSDKQTMTEVNVKLAVGNMGISELKKQSLQTTGWELAYSHRRNDVVIVDESDNIVAALNKSLVGTKLTEDYVRISMLDEENDDGGPDKWKDSTKVEGSLPEENKDKYKNEHDLYLDDDITSIPDGFFKDNTNLERIYIGAGISVIPVSAFEGCINLKEVYLAAPKVVILGKAFRNCKKLDVINLQNVTEIGNSAFIDCNALQAIKLDSVESLGEYAFMRTGLLEINLPKILKTIYGNTFNNCKIKKLTLFAPEVNVNNDSVNSEDVTIEELKIGGEETIELSINLCTWIDSLIENSAKAETGNTLKRVTVRNIKVAERGTPFKNMKDGSELVIEDQASYDSLKESFGNAKVTKKWES